MDIENVFFVINIFYAVGYQYIFYLFGKKRLDVIKDLSVELSNINILFSKIFQCISISSNLLNNDEIIYLSNYNDNVRYDFNEEIKIEDVILSLNNEITLVNKTPIKSGLISLVYAGVLNYNQKPVIIKVLRKNIHNTLFNACMKFRFLINVISYIPYVSLLQLNDAFSENFNNIMQQTNFTTELKNLQQFYEAYKNIDDIIIPEVYEKYTYLNSNVIVMEKLEGCTMVSLEHKNRYKYADLMAKFTLKSILFDGIFHSDLHSGNVFFMRENNKCKLGIIDFGIIGKITETEQNIYYKFFKSGFINKNYLNASNILLNHLVSPKNQFKLIEKHRKTQMLLKITNIARKVFNSEKNFDIDFVTNINKILSEYKLKLSKNFTKIQIALGICYTLCNELCIDDSKKYINSINNIIKKLIIE